MSDTTKANVLIIAPELDAIISNIAQQYRISAATVSNLAVYSVTLNTTTVSYTTDASATKEEIATGLIAAIQSDPTTNALVACTNSLDGTFLITAKTAGTSFSVSVSTKLIYEETIKNFNGDELFELILDDVTDEITSLDIVEDFQEKAQRYLMAHLLYLQLAADASGLTATSENVGRASVSYSDKFLDENDLKKTRWGVGFLRIWKKYRYLRILA